MLLKKLRQSKGNQSQAVSAEKHIFVLVLRQITEQHSKLIMNVSRNDKERKSQQEEYDAITAAFDALQKQKSGA